MFARLANYILGKNFGVPLVCVLRSSGDIHRLRTCTLRKGKFRIGKFRRPGDFCGTLSARGPSLVVVSIVLPNRSNISVAGGLHTDSRFGHVPVIVMATGSSRVSTVGKLSNNTSSCVAGPFSIVVFVSHIGTILHHICRDSRHHSCACGAVAISSGGRGICSGNGRIRLAFGRCRVLGCLLHGGNVTMAERRLLGGV